MSVWRGGEGEGGRERSRMSKRSRRTRRSRMSRMSRRSRSQDGGSVRPSEPSGVRASLRQVAWLHDQP